MKRYSGVLADGGHFDCKFPRDWYQKYYLGWHRLSWFPWGSLQLQSRRETLEVMAEWTGTKGGRDFDRSAQNSSKLARGRCRDEGCSCVDWWNTCKSGQMPPSQTLQKEKKKDSIKINTSCTTVWSTYHYLFFWMGITVYYRLVSTGVSRLKYLA